MPVAGGLVQSLRPQFGDHPRHLCRDHLVLEAAELIHSKKNFSMIMEPF
jgi:hypothetical protein